MAQKKTERLVSLDALRGFDMFFIMGGDALLASLFLLSPGTAGLARQMNHAPWHGFTALDLVFPLFLFIAGVSFPFSLARQAGAGCDMRAIRMKIVRRGLTLFVLGVVYNGLLQFDFGNLRYASVLGRIGLAWMFAALLYTWLSRKVLAGFGVVLLLAYWGLLGWGVAPDAPVGADGFSPEGSVVGYVDRLCLPGRLHNGIHDPEGILSTLPAIVTALLGMAAGTLLKTRRNGNAFANALMLAIAGVGLLAAGWLWDGLCPVNKNLWTSSFVCVAGGWSYLLLSLFYLLVDGVGLRRLAFPFTVIGMNSITIYLAQEFVDFGHTSRALFGGLIRMAPEAWQTAGFWLAYTVTCWLLVYGLYRKKMFLKV